MTQEELLEIKKEMDKAQEDTTPFVAVSDENIAVIGDPNKTDLKKYDYTMIFNFPVKGDPGKYTEHEVEYNNVFVSARQNPRIVALLNKLMPYFRKPLPDGTVVDYTRDEAVEILSEFEDNINDLLYKLVGSVLGVDPSLQDYMRYDKVVEAFVQIVHNIPEMVNEADMSFPYNSGTISRFPQ